jgi:hypothetical protein
MTYDLQTCRTEFYALDIPADIQGPAMCAVASRPADLLVAQSELGNTFGELYVYRKRHSWNSLSSNCEKSRIGDGYDGLRNVYRGVRTCDWFPSFADNDQASEDRTDGKLHEDSNVR